MNEDTPGATERESLGSIIVEVEGLNAALSVADGFGDAERARESVLATLTRKPEPETIADAAVVAAMRRILDEDVVFPEMTPSAKPAESQVADAVALAWVAWAAGEPETAKALLDFVPPQNKDGTGAVHLIALGYWAEGVRHLVDANLPSAHRFFKRAIELGAQFGTESHPVVSWTYAASFFENRPRPALAKCNNTTAAKRLTSAG